MKSPRKIFKAHSTTYYYASRFLPSQQRKDIECVYAFLRVPDEYVDTEPKDEKSYQGFKQAWYGSNTHPVVSVYREVHKRRGFDDAWVDSFFASMDKDLIQSAYETEEELFDYIYGSAEIVGLMLCRILQVDQKWTEEAKLLGRFMQYVNMLRDIREDCENSLFYIPEETYSSYGINDFERAITQEHEEILHLVRKEAERSLEWYESVQEAIHHIPLPSRIAIQTAADMYAWTAQQLIQNPSQSLKKKAMPSRSRILLQGSYNTVKCYIN